MLEIISLVMVWFFLGGGGRAGGEKEQVVEGDSESSCFISSS